MRRPPPPLDPKPASRVTPGLRRFLRSALAEDRAHRDRTTRSLLPRRFPGTAVVVAQARGTASGVGAARALALGERLRVRALVPDGGPVRPGTRVLELRGDVRRILAVERTLLNLLMHLSGVATATARAVQRARSRQGGPAVFATRKTIPGLRDLEKQAVIDGGGHAHRRDLSDALLLKRSHLRLVPLEEAVRRARGPRRRFVEVEVGTLREAERALRAGADALLVDNLSPAAARALVGGLARAGLRDRAWVELSGGITPENVGRYAHVGADAVSLGALTHSAPAVPFHLVVESGRPASRPR